MKEKVDININKKIGYIKNVKNINLAQKNYTLDNNSKTNLDIINELKAENVTLKSKNRILKESLDNKEKIIQALNNKINELENSKNFNNNQDEKNNNINNEIRINDDKDLNNKNKVSKKNKKRKKKRKKSGIVIDNNIINNNIFSKIKPKKTLNQFLDIAKLIPEIKTNKTNYNKNKIIKINKKILFSK